MHFSLKPVLAVAAASLSLSSLAATVQYSNRAAFTAAVGPVATNDLNSFVVDVPLSGGVVVPAGAFTITGPNSGVARIDAGGDGATPVDGTAYVQGIGAAGSAITFTFANAITAFGVDLFGINNGADRTFVRIGADVFNLPVVAGNQSSFFGVSSDVAFNTVAFTLRSGEDAGLDNISFVTAAAVPTPSSLALVLAAGGALAFARTRPAKRRD